MDFSDAAFWKTFDRKFGSLGAGGRLSMVRITRSNVRAWFHYTLLARRRPILKDDRGRFGQLNHIDTVGKDN